MRGGAKSAPPVGFSLVPKINSWEIYSYFFTFPYNEFGELGTTFCFYTSFLVAQRRPWKNVSWSSAGGIVPIARDQQIKQLTKQDRCHLCMLQIVFGLLFSVFILVAVWHWNVKKLRAIGATLGAHVGGWFPALRKEGVNIIQHYT